MWTSSVCPYFKYKSFTFINTLVQLLIYFMLLLMCATDQKYGMNDKMFLGVHPHILDEFGMRMPFKVVLEHEWWRLLTSLYVTHSFSTIVINTFAQLVLGFALERLLGFCRMGFFYLLTGFSANALATACTDRYAAGPEPALLGLLGGLMAMYLFLWERIQVILCYKVGGCCLLVFATCISVFVTVMIAQPYNTYMKLHMIEYPDTFGLMGGLLYGFFFCWVFLPVKGKKFCQRESNEKCCFYAGLIITVSINSIVIPYLFLFPDSTKDYWSAEAEQKGLDSSDPPESN